MFPIWRKLLSKDIDFFRCPTFVTWLTNFQSDITTPKVKYFCFLLYSRLGNGAPLVTKLVLEIHKLCNKNEISYVKESKNVTLLTMDLPHDFSIFHDLLVPNLENATGPSHVHQNITESIIFYVGPQCHFCSGIFHFSMTFDKRFPWFLQASWKSVIQIPWIFQVFHDRKYPVYCNGPNIALPTCTLPVIITRHTSAK